MVSNCENKLSAKAKQITNMHAPIHTLFLLQILGHWNYLHKTVHSTKIVGPWASDAARI